MKISPVSYASWLDFLDKDTNFSQAGIFKGNHTKSKTSKRRFINRYWFYLSSLIKQKRKWFTNFQRNRTSQFKIYEHWENYSPPKTKQRQNTEYVISIKAPPFIIFNIAMYWICKNAEVLKPQGI